MNNEDILKVKIMGREFNISCSEQERTELLLAAELLEDKIQKIRKEGKIIDSDRIVIAAALNIAHELLILRQSSGFDIDEIKRRIAGIRKKINDVLVKK
ncbi:cell division protein ZapA [Nitrosomonas sp.]|uniref:cell division protein ZapA n=1 Tax=Nitrosomonas sp. TaxID=42353 RepID=UPI001DD496F6|nr:cell division protein ZapA [Nitrosomonas sp.]MCB1948604.1 cell division protein ZapA [Nitrosomonas sp.]MCP5242201.1 cell division protein ZapA [Burkholderiales bacterium]MDR4514217.1 cell division protein ZapA [Nitrosomonas sp.]